MDTLSTDLLLWARGPGFMLAATLFLLGLCWRLLEIYSLGPPRDLAPPAQRRGSGLRTLLLRSMPERSTLRRDPITYLAGYLFHIGFAVTLLLFAPHIQLFHNLFGISWPALPSVVIDAVTVMTILTLLLVALRRWFNPVRRLLSGFDDWLSLLLTLLPLITGYITLHHLFADYAFWLALHILSAELLLVLLPFTKLLHMVTLFFSRWYTGERYAKRGVKV